MKLRKQVILTEESWTAVEELIRCTNEGFKLGHINHSDAINAMILSSKVNVETLRAKHADVRRTLKSMANKKELDIDALIKDLTELKSKTVRRRNAVNNKEGV